jgi:hypothetical protein
MAEDISVLLIQTRRALHLSQRELGERLGMVKRTMQRWEARGAILLPSHIRILATALYPENPALAARMAAYGHTSLRELGLEVPPPALLPPVAPLATSILVDSILCVAADAIGVAPSAIRPALAKAFLRAREVALDVSAVADSLTGDGGGKKAARRTAATKAASPA